MAHYAAVDIGSNSVRMMVAEAAPGGGLQTIAQERQVTRLGASVFHDGRIAPEAIDFVCDNLARMAAEFRRYPLTGIRAVATSAVRDAANQDEFVERTQAALGYPVEVISGQEEARLIHLGVQARWPHPDQRVLIIDLGGGSTEIIFDDRGVLEEAFSKPLGAVRLTEVFLKSDPPSEVELLRMNEYIEEKLAGPVDRIGVQPFDRAIATSATAAALVCAANGIPRPRRDEADRMRATTAQIRKLYRELCQASLEQRRQMTGIGPRRAELIVAGGAVFLKALEAFHLETLYYSVAGVRDGILADLAYRGSGAQGSHLSAEQRRAVEELTQHYGVQLEHARKVAGLSYAIFSALQPLHKLAPNYGKLLEAAAYLHDVGHFVSDTGHHKHSYYLVANSDLPAFTDRERQFIAALCRYHRKSMPVARHPQYQALGQADRQPLLYLTPLLRVADSLDRGHHQRVDDVRVELRNGSVAIVVASKEPADLELWAADRIGEQFRSVYGVPLLLRKA